MSVKYIFCVSTGRCGTDYLAGLFKSVENCDVYHEQQPLLHNEDMRQYLKGNKTPLKEKFKEKLKHIMSDKGEIYVDTSHLFIKGFGWEIPEHIPQEQLGVIILKRDKEQTVQSTYRVQSGPFTYYGRKWIIVPNGHNTTKPPISHFRYTAYRAILKLYWVVKGQNKQIEKTYPKFFKRKALALIRWYYDETYALADVYRKRFPNVTYVSTTLDDLNSTVGFMKLIKAFKLERALNTTKLEELIGKPKNLKKEFH